MYFFMSIPNNIHRKIIIHQFEYAFNLKIFTKKLNKLQVILNKYEKH